MVTCKKSGCKRETSRKYCSQHRCKAVESCEYPRQRQSGVCADHTTCTKAGCDEPRWFNNDPRAANTSCEEHLYSCRVADCFSIPATLPASDDQPPNYCEAHSCSVAECSAPPQAGFTSCQDHLCGVQKCNGSGARHSQSYHYCHEHTCKVYNCANKKSSRGAACRQHRCAVADCQETGDTTKGRTCCELHACQLPGCENLSRHAQNPAKVSPFCTGHDCRAPGCERARDLDGGRSYCEAHDLCGKVGCESIKHPTKRFCDEHWDTCSRLDCFTRRKYHLITHSGWYSPAWWSSDRYYSYTKESDAAEYCPSHTCKGCFAARESGRVYCAAHDVCAKKDCSRVVSSGVSHCSKHEDRCHVKDCFNWRVGEGQPFCSSHGCAAPGCGQPREKKSRYCGYYHKSCEAPECTGPCEPPDQACSDAHRCRRSGCLEAISSREVDYCLQDICKAERCSSARQSVFDRKVGHEFCINHESMARRFRPNRALPSSDVKAFNNALLLLLKKKEHASGNSGGTGFVVGEVIDDSVPANGYPGDDYGGLNHDVNAGPSYPYASSPDEGRNPQGDYALHAEQDASSSAANDAVDTLAQYFDPDTLADDRLDASPSYPYASSPDEGGNPQGDYVLHAKQDASSSAANDAVDTLAQYFDPDTLADDCLNASPSYPYAFSPDEGGNPQVDYALHAEQDASSSVANDAVQYKPKYADAVDTLAQYFDLDTLADDRLDAGPSYPYASSPDEGGNPQGDYALHAEQDASSSVANDAVQYKPKYADVIDTLAKYFDPDTLADHRLDTDNFQGYIVPGEEYTAVCGIFRHPPSGEEQSQGLEQVAGDAFRDHGAYEV